MRQIGLLHQPHSHGLSMDQRFVAPQRFKGMTDRMPIVQDTPAIGLPFIRGHHLRLDFARSLDDGRDDIGMPRPQGGHFPFQVLKEPLVGDDAVFDYLCDPRDPLPFGKGAQRERVDPDCLRLIKRPD